MNFIQKKMNKKGFTLVELIIVIAVMAILAAIVIPRMSGITESFKVKADERVAESIAREIEVIILNGGTVVAHDLASDVLTQSAIGTPEQTGTGLGFYYSYETDTNTVSVYVATETNAGTLNTAIQALTASNDIDDVKSAISSASNITSSVVRGNVTPIE